MKAAERTYPPLTIDVELQPKELQLLEMMEGDSQLIGYGGARGGAKSHAVRAVAVLRRLKYPGTSGMIFRRTYDQLWQQHVMPMMTEWPDLFKRYWNGENKALMLPGNSPLLFRYADTLKDVLEFKGKEYGDLFIDEATDMEETELQILYSCNRSPVRGFRPKKVLTFNPGGKGHAYVKRVFVDRELTTEEKALNVAFIQAYAWDNVIWVRDALEADGVAIATWYEWPREKQIEYLVTRSDYGKDLNQKPEHLRKPWLYGDWDTFLGQVFEEFSRDVHVVDSAPMQPWWHYWLCNDPGQADPGVWYLLGADTQGLVWVLREWSFSKREWYSQQAKQVAADLKKMAIKPSFSVTGMDAFVARFENGKGITSYYEAEGLDGWREPDHGSGCRSRRAGVVHEYLRPFNVPVDPERPELGERKIARLRIVKTCRELIRTLPSLPHDPNEPEAVEECSADHWYDALGYGLQAWHAKKSAEPAQPAYKAGSLGEVLGHAKKLGTAKKAGGIEW